MDLFPPDWSPPAELPRLSGAVAIDLETHDPLLKTHGPSWFARGQGRIVGYALAWGTGGNIDAGYWPVAHQGGGNIEREPFERWLADQLRRPDLTWIVANATYDLGWLKRAGFPWPAGRIIDVQILAPLIDENRMSYSLAALAKTYLGERKGSDEIYQAAKSFGHKDAMGDLHKLPAPYVGPYAEQDARLTLQLYERFAPMIEAQGLGQVSTLEHDLIPLLVAMRNKGVRVDEEAVAHAERYLKAEEAKAHAALKEAAGFHVDVWAAQSIARAFDALRLEYPRTENTGQPSFTKEFLKECNAPIAANVLRVRELSKALSTFVEGHIKGHLWAGRIHPQFNALRREHHAGGGAGTVTGRFSSDSPNMQQIPSKGEEISPLLRACFLPEEGETWGVFDYSQQEPRLLVHYAALSGVTGGAQAARQYADDPATDFHAFVAWLAGIPRKYAKTINLAIMYGMGGAGMARALGLPTETDLDGKERAGAAASALLRQYHERLPFVDGMTQTAKRAMVARGYVRTLLGRRCRVDNERFAFRALNRLIQGSAADQTKAAMLAVHKATGLVPLLQVHDELDYSLPDGPHTDIPYKEQVAEAMREAVKLQVPMRVDVGLGASWAEASKE